MTVSTQYQPFTFKPGAAMTAEAIPWQFLAGEQIVVTHIEAVTAAETVLVLGDDYSISGSGPDGTGSVTALAAWPVNDDFRVERATSLEQEYELPPFEAIRSSALERENDRQLMALQEQVSTLTRAVLAPVGQDAPKLDIAGLIEGDILEYRGGKFRRFLREAFAGKFFAGDASGRPVPASGFGADADLRTDLASGLIGTLLIAWKAAGVGAVVRTLWARLNDLPPGVRDFGAAGNGVANDRAAIALADATGGFRFTAGSYLISSSITIASDISFDAGARLIIPTGVTVTFTGCVTAGVSQIFQCTGTGAVAFNWNKTWAGCAEWWGAKPNDSAAGTQTANVNAINAALIALRKTQLQGADYWINARIYMGEPWRELSGVGERFAGSTSNFVTRILQTSATADVMQVGPDSYPGSINALFQGNKVNDIYLGRTVAPNIISACSGLKNQYTLYARFDNVMTAESIFGFQFYGTVQTHAYRSWAFRSGAGAGAGSDRFYGFYVNGTASIAGLSSGNASIYLNYCNATVGGSPPVDSVGFYCNSGFTDTFLESPETTSCRIGIYVIGNGVPGSYEYTNGDMQIKHPNLDAFTYAGIYFQNMNRFGSAEVIGGYYGAASGCRAAVAADSCLGQIRVAGGQAIMRAAATASGVGVENSNGVTIDGLIVLEAGVSGVDASNVKNCVFKPIVKNYSMTISAAVRLFNTNSRNVIRPVAYGSANVFGLGVQLVGANHNHNEINCSGMDPAAITGGSVNKLTINGTQVTQTGLSGTNLVQGVMA
jgi:hypothetical protein